MELTDIRSVLAIVAHPDDIEAFCAGTFALLRQQGTVITYLHLTSGDKGSPDPLVVRAELAARREAEQRAAAALLGVDDLIFLGYPDGEVTDDLPTRAAIAAQLRRVRPDLLVTFDPWHSYTFHNDHRQCGLVALAAARATAQHSGPAHTATGQVLDAAAPGHLPRAAWLFHTHKPTRIIDVTTVIDLKAAARVAHTSQTADPVATARGIRERAANAGMPHGVAFAETFCEVQFPADESVRARLAAGEL